MKKLKFSIFFVLFLFQYLNQLSASKVNFMEVLFKNDTVWIYDTIKVTVYDTIKATVTDTVPNKTLNENLPDEYIEIIELTDSSGLGKVKTFKTKKDTSLKLTFFKKVENKLNKTVPANTCEIYNNNMSYLIGLKRGRYFFSYPSVHIAGYGGTQTGVFINRKIRGPFSFQTEFILGYKIAHTPGEEGYQILENYTLNYRDYSDNLYTSYCYSAMDYALEKPWLFFSNPVFLRFAAINFLEFDFGMFYNLTTPVGSDKNYILHKITGTELNTIKLYSFDWGVLTGVNIKISPVVSFGFRYNRGLHINDPLTWQDIDHYHNQVVVYKPKIYSVQYIIWLEVGLKQFNSFKNIKNGKTD